MMKTKMSPVHRYLPAGGLVTPSCLSTVTKLQELLCGLLTPNCTPIEWMERIQKSLYANRADPVFMQMRLLRLLYNTKLDIEHDKHTIVLIVPLPYDPQTQAGKYPRVRGYAISCEPTTSGIQKKKAYHIRLRIIENYTTLTDSLKGRKPDLVPIKKCDIDEDSTCGADTGTGTADVGNPGPNPNKTADDGVLLVIDLNSILHYAEACIPVTGDSLLTHVSEYREVVDLAHPTLLPSVSRLLYRSTDERMLILTYAWLEKLHTRVCGSLRIKPDIAWTITSNIDMKTLTANMNLHACRSTADVLIWTRNEAFYRCMDRNLSAYFIATRLAAVTRETLSSPGALAVVNRLECLPSNRSSYSCVFVNVGVTDPTDDIAHRAIEALSIECRLQGIKCYVLKESSILSISGYLSFEHPTVVVFTTSVVCDTGPSNYVFGSNLILVLDPTTCTASIFNDIILTATTPVDPPRDMRLTPVIKTAQKSSDRVSNFTIYPVDNIITATPLFLCTRTTFASTNFRLNTRVKVLSTGGILIYEWHYNHDLPDMPPDYYFVAHSPPGMERMFELVLVYMAGKLRSLKTEQHTFEAQLRYDVQSEVTQSVMVFVTPMLETQLQLPTARHCALYALPTPLPPVQACDPGFSLMKINN
jgi:hypothetical protein